MTPVRKRRFDRKQGYELHSLKKKKIKNKKVIFDTSFPPNTNLSVLRNS